MFSRSSSTSLGDVHFALSSKLWGGFGTIWWRRVVLRTNDVLGRTTRWRLLAARGRIPGGPLLKPVDVAFSASSRRQHLTRCQNVVLKYYTRTLTTNDQIHQCTNACICKVSSRLCFFSKFHTQPPLTDAKFRRANPNAPLIWDGRIQIFGQTFSLPHCSGRCQLAKSTTRGSCTECFGSKN